MSYLEQRYQARPLVLPGLLLQPGDEVLIVDSRGRVVKGIFIGYASKFVALASECGQQPSRFLNIQRINEIIVLGRAKCVEREGGKEVGGNGANPVGQGEA